MNFKPELAALVMSGEKTVTRRLVSDNPRSPWFHEKCALQVGHDYAVCPGRGKNAIGRVLIESARVEQLGEISDEEARREGFPDREVFQAAWLAINGRYDPAVWVWRVAMVVLDAPVNGVMSIEAVKALQADRGLGDVHVVHLAPRSFTIAHTDAERAASEPLTSCALHQWLLALGGPPVDRGLYVAERNQPDLVSDSYRGTPRPWSLKALADYAPDWCSR